MRVLFGAICWIAFVGTWLTMGAAISLNLLGLSRSDLQLAERLQIGFQRSVTGELRIAATVLCTLSALTQYAIRHTIRRIVEEGQPTQTRGFRWMRAAQSVAIAWALWYAMLIAHCLK